MNVAKWRPGATLIRAHLDRSLEKVTPAVQLGLSRETLLAQKAVTL